MIRAILRMGDPRLRQVAEPVADPVAPAVAALVADMIETMRAADGVGLAAPQTGVGLRIIVFGFDHDPRYPDAPPVPPTALVNPSFQPLSQAVEDGWEGCLSIPGLRGAVPRAADIRYRGIAPDGTPVEREATGFHARVVQHEIDHLDVVLYPDRLIDRTRFGFTKELFPKGYPAPASRASPRR